MEQAIGNGEWASAPASGTVVLPFTPAMARALDRRIARRVRATRNVLVGTAAICILGAAAITIIYPPIFVLGLLMIACAAFLVWSSAALNRRAVRSMRSGVFCRTEGRLKVEGGDLPYLRVDDVWVAWLPRTGRAIKRLPFGVVDYTQGGVEVIEIRDAWGKVYYRMPGYTP